MNGLPARVPQVLSDPDLKEVDELARRSVNCPIEISATVPRMLQKKKGKGKKGDGPRVVGKTHDRSVFFDTYLIPFVRGRVPDGCEHPSFFSASRSARFRHTRRRSLPVAHSRTREDAFCALQACATAPAAQGPLTRPPPPPAAISSWY